MARPGVIDRLPGEVRERIGQLRADGRTRDEIRAAIERDHGIRIARSTMGDWLKRFDAVHARLRHSRAAAETLIARLGDAPDHRLGRINVELAHGLLLDLLAEVGAGEQVDPRALKDLAEALARLAQAAKNDVERERTIRRECAKAAATAAESAARGEGLSDATVQRVRASILGTADPATSHSK